MTTVDDTDLMQVAEIDHTEIQIETEHGPFSIAAVREIEDLPDRARIASAVTRVAEEKADLHRSTRDMAALVLIRPFQAAQRPYDAAMEQIDADLEAGKITQATARERRAEARETRRKAMEHVQYKPADIWARTIGVSRAAFARMMRRALPELPTFRINGRPMTPEQIRTLAINSRNECALYDAIADDARTIRDDVVTMLLNGNRKVGRPPMSNADVSRLTGLTTARVAQIRYGTR